MLQRHRIAGRPSTPIFEGKVRRYLVPQFGTRLLTDVSGEDIEAYAVALTDRGLKPSTINVTLQPLRAAFKLYGRERGIPVPSVLLLEARNTREVFFERPEFQLVVDQLAEPLKPIAWFSYFTGWRMQSEVLPLRWDVNVRWDAGVVVIPADRTKNRCKKEFPFRALPEVEQLLRAQHTAATALATPCPWVFFRFGGKPVTSWYRAWRGAVCRSLCHCGKQWLCGSRLRIPHDLRRTAARNLREAGVADSIIMDLCGWKTIRQLRAYLGETPTRVLFDAVSRLGTR